MKEADMPQNEVAEYRRVMNEQKARMMKQVMAKVSDQLAHRWDQIEEARDRSTHAQELRDTGLAREFYLNAVQQMATVENEAREAQRELAAFLVLDLDQSAASVAHTAGVAPSTVHRWLKDAKSPELRNYF